MSDLARIKAVVRAALADHGRLAVSVDDLTDGDDLWRAGLTSHNSVTVMLACEDAFGVEFTQPMLNRRTFTSIDALAGALATLVTT